VWGRLQNWEIGESIEITRKKGETAKVGFQHKKISGDLPRDFVKATLLVMPSPEDGEDEGGG
jgi:hypothetical protein